MSYVVSRKNVLCVADVDGGELLPRRSGPLSVVSVLGVDLCVAENGAIHNTSRFELMARGRDSRLVVRRGQAFALVLALSRPFLRHRDAVSFIFSVVGKPLFHATKRRNCSFFPYVVVLFCLA